MSTVLMRQVMLVEKYFDAGTIPIDKYLYFVMWLAKYVVRQLDFFALSSKKCMI